MDIKQQKILITGGAGFLGTHLVGKLIEHGVARENIAIVRSAEHDLRLREQCDAVVAGKDLVFHLAAKVGGIGFNQKNPGELFYDNMILGAHMVDAAYRAGVKKMVALGTICSYPKVTPVPFKEADLWNGYPEETNAPYGLAKKALITQAAAYQTEYGFDAISLLPVNLYGPGDNFDPDSSHVIPALIKKISDAQEAGHESITVWGTGNATREFLYAEDAAEGIVLAAEKYDKPEPVNLGSGREISIKVLVQTIAKLMNFKGEILWDTTKPDGQPRRSLDITHAELEFGFRAKTTFETGLQATIAWYDANKPRV